MASEESSSGSISEREIKIEVRTELMLGGNFEVTVKVRI
jgi:hypothetical protein